MALPPDAGRAGAIKRKGSGNMGGIPGGSAHAPIAKVPVTSGPIPKGGHSPAQGIRHNKIGSPNTPTPATGAANNPIKNVNSPTNNSGLGEGNTKMAPPVGSTNTTVGKGPSPAPAHNPPFNKAPGGFMKGNPIVSGKPTSIGKSGTPAPWKNPGIVPPANNRPDIAAAAARVAAKGK